LQALAGGVAAPKRSRLPLVLGAVGVVAVIVAVTAVLLWPKPQPVTPPAPTPVVAPIVEKARPGVLQVSSKPPGAKIVVDGADSGKITPASLTGLSENKPHKVQLLLDGHEPWTADPYPTVTAGGTASVQAELRKVGAPPAPVARAHGARSGARPAGTAKDPKTPPKVESKPGPKPATKRTKLIDDI
jgi:serine/threonine-protein kinase